LIRYPAAAQRVHLVRVRRACVRPADDRGTCTRMGTPDLDFQVVAQAIIISSIALIPCGV
jgi:hypothetical protein